MARTFFTRGIGCECSISIKFGKGRDAETSKGYGALFMFVATKAVYIEAFKGKNHNAFKFCIFNAFLCSSIKLW